MRRVQFDDAGRMGQTIARFAFHSERDWSVENQGRSIFGRFALLVVENGIVPKTPYRMPRLKAKQSPHSRPRITNPHARSHDYLVVGFILPLLNLQRTSEAVTLMENAPDFGREFVTLRGVFFFHHLFYELF